MTSTYDLLKKVGKKPSVSFPTECPMTCSMDKEMSLLKMLRKGRRRYELGTVLLRNINAALDKFIYDH